MKNRKKTITVLGLTLTSEGMGAEGAVELFGCENDWTWDARVRVYRHPKQGGNTWRVIAANCDESIVISGSGPTLDEAVARLSATLDLVPVMRDWVTDLVRRKAVA